MPSTLPAPSQPDPSLPAWILVVLVLAMLASMVVSLGIVYPFFGSLVRVRANYNPRSVAIDDEGGARFYAGPRLTGVFSTLRRTINLEGFRGLYKGITVAIITALLQSTFATLLLTWAFTHPADLDMDTLNPGSGMLALMLYALALTLVSIPLEIIQIRSIVTPARLPWNMKSSLKILLSEKEYRSPLVLYRTPGLVIGIFIQSIAVAALRNVVKYAIVGNVSLQRSFNGQITRRALSASTTSLDEEPQGEVATWRWILYFALMLLTVAWATPIDVILTKLCVQANEDEVNVGDGAGVPLFSADGVGNDAGPGAGSGAGTSAGGNGPSTGGNGGNTGHEGDEEDPRARISSPTGLNYIGTDEDVVGLRPPTEPYTGFINAGRKIAEEEGWGALYRAWWWSALGAFVIALN